MADQVLKARGSNAEDEKPRKAIKKVVSGKVKTKKKNGIKSALISEDVTNVKSYILTDVLIPAIKDAVVDTVINGIEMIMYGETKRDKKHRTSSKVSYRKFYDDGKRDRESYSSRARNGYSYEDIIVESRAEGEEVLDRMGEIIDEYKFVSVADLYDLVGISGNYTDNKYGWTNIRNAQVTRVRKGFLIELPKALPID